MQEDAREVAKATGVDFGDDAVGAIMKKYDTNGDGVFQVNEYAEGEDGGWQAAEAQGQQEVNEAVGRVATAVEM